jgi:hypothetical protein
VRDPAIAVACRTARIQADAGDAVCEERGIPSSSRARPRRDPSGTRRSTTKSTRRSRRRAAKAALITVAPTCAPNVAEYSTSGSPQVRATRIPRSLPIDKGTEKPGPS